MASSDEKQAAVNFANIFCNLLDKHRSRLFLYLDDDAVLDWFGRTIQGKESISGFMNLEIPQTVHTFTSVEPSGPIQHRSIFPVEPMDQDGSIVLEQKEKSFDGTLSDDDDDDDDCDLAKPLGNPDQSEATDSKGQDVVSELNLNNLSFKENDNSKTEQIESWESRFTTPLPRENTGKCQTAAGQGDCFAKPKVRTLTEAKRFLEAEGLIHFERRKQNKRMSKSLKLASDVMKWDRFCKLKIAYSISAIQFHNKVCGDGLDNDFKIWLLAYQDNTKCRRNLLNDFEQVN